MSILDCLTVDLSTVACDGNDSAKTEEVFWQQWLQYQDYLYCCCLRWMGGNPADAEDALSSAMLKAWEKQQKSKKKIINFKAWLTRLTFNLCVDIHRKRSRSANLVNNMDIISEKQKLFYFDMTPEKVLEEEEKKMIIRCYIENLPLRLHETFILHFYEELPYAEIAKHQDISYQNVCKRISEARTILRKKLRIYFIFGNTI